MLGAVAKIVSAFTVPLPIPASPFSTSVEVLPHTLPLMLDCNGSLYC